MVRYRYFSTKRKLTKSGYEVVDYILQGDASEIIKLYQEKFASKKEAIEKLLETLSKESWTKNEIIATLYAVWNNRLIRNKKITEEDLTKDFFDWSEHKAIYSKEQVKQGLNWMKEKGIIPDRWGKVIEKAK